MRSRCSHARRKRPDQQQGGYAILLVLFLATLMLLATMAVAPNILTEGRREKEQEMIWRGKQYVRGIKLYYRKTGKFPTSLDDLTKPKMGSIRFMRQAYKDPMNVKDGEWRLIYVGPAGQLIGSLKPKRAIQLSAFGGAQAVAAPTIGTNVPGAAGGALGLGPGFGQALGQAANQIGGNGGAASPTSSLAPSSGALSADTSQPGGLADSADSDAANEELLASDPPEVVGGNIIGVGSKINQRSVMVYDKAKNYRQFEFIWDPSKDAIGIGAAPQNTALPGTQPAPLGSNPQGAGGAANPVEPAPLPPETTPNPPEP